MGYVDASVGLRARILERVPEWDGQPLGVSTRADGPRPHLHLDPVPTGPHPREGVIVEQQVKLNAYPGVDAGDDAALDLAAACRDAVAIVGGWTGASWTAGGLLAIRCTTYTDPHLVPDLSPREPRALASVLLRYRLMQQTP